MFIHVDNGHFCGSSYLSLRQRMAKQGILFPTANHQPPSHPRLPLPSRGASANPFALSLSKGTPHPDTNH